MKLNFMLTIVLIGIFMFLTNVSQSFRIRLKPTSDEKNEGFVEAYHNGTWGYIGNPSYRFSDETASVFCKILGISYSGYGVRWAQLKNYVPHTWFDVDIYCHGNETDAGQCKLTGDWNKRDYTGNGYGSKLSCVESALILGDSHNSGIVLSTFNRQIYRSCYDGFNMRTARIVCRSLGYNEPISFEAVKTNLVKLNTRSRTLRCIGHESRLSSCAQMIRRFDCNQIASVTCKAVRLRSMNKHEDEGVLEVFYQGAWGIIGQFAWKFDDVTSAHLCKTFGFGNNGFSTYFHDLGEYKNVGWLGKLRCSGNETNIMTCDHDIFSLKPPMLKPHQPWPWLYCFPYNIDGVRLKNGSDRHEGRVELRIKGRWGLICTTSMKHERILTVGRVICKQLGYTDITDVMVRKGLREDLFWMSLVFCGDSDKEITSCHFRKGSSLKCYKKPTYLHVRCKT